MTISDEAQTQVAVSLDRTRRALVQQTAAMLIVVGVVAIVMAMRVTDLSTPALAAALSAVLVCAVSIVLSRSQLPAIVSAVILISSWLTALFVVAYLRGGLNAPLLIAVPIVPVIAATVISTRAAWVVLTCIFVGLAMLAGLATADYAFPLPVETDRQYDWMRALWVALASLLATQLATYNTRRSERLTRRLQDLASTDDLTQVANRRAIIALLGTEIARAERNDTSLAVLLLDVDHFKMLNDQRGHVAGDAALAELAAAVSSRLRASGDAVGRWGGEEFLVILPHTGREAAIDAAERIRRCVADLNIPYGGDASDCLTVTIGVAVFPGSGTKTVNALLGLVDEALYRGKSAGRNRVVLVDQTSNAAVNRDS